jgi:hypothetical protein
MGTRAEPAALREVEPAASLVARAAVSAAAAMAAVDTAKRSS